MRRSTICLMEYDSSIIRSGEQTQSSDPDPPTRLIPPPHAEAPDRRRPISRPKADTTGWFREAVNNAINNGYAARVSANLSPVSKFRRASLKPPSCEKNRLSRSSHHLVDLRGPDVKRRSIGTPGRTIKLHLGSAPINTQKIMDWKCDKTLRAASWTPQKPRSRDGTIALPLSIGQNSHNLGLYEPDIP